MRVLEAVRLQRRIVVFAVAVLAVVAIVVATVAIVPMQRQMRESADRALDHGLALNTVAAGEIAARAHDLVRQVTSRSVIRDALVRYNRGESTIEELAAFTADKLADSMRLSDEILGITRTDREGRVVVSVGRAIPAHLWLPGSAPPPGLGRPAEIDDGYAMVLSEAILGRDGQSEGADVMLFDASALKALVDDRHAMGSTGEFILADRQGAFFPTRRGAGTLPEALGKAGDQPAIVRGDGDDGEPEVTAVRRLPGTDWIAISRMAEEELHFQVDSIVATVLVVVIGLIASGTAGLWLLLRPMAGRMLIHTTDLAREVEDHRHAEEQLRALNRAMRTLSAGNQALVHADSEKGLLATMCGVIVEAGGYVGASVTIDHGDGRVAGNPKIAALTAETGLPTQAVGTGRAVAVPDIDDEAMLKPWRDAYRSLGVRSLLVLPLAAPGGQPAVGALVIHAGQPHVFAVPEERQLLEELAGDLAYGIQTLRGRAALEKALEGTIQAVATTIEVRDPYTAGHQKRVADIAVAIGRRMQLGEIQLKGLFVAGLIHDIGKVSVPAEILTRPSRLSETEFAIIRSHPRTGWDILSGVDFPWPVADAVLHHHERLDGSGYPDGLKGDEISLEARILAVADVVEAIASHRPYRPALGLEVALEEVVAHKGTHYDPRVVDICLQLVRDGALVLR